MQPPKQVESVSRHLFFCVFSTKLHNKVVSFNQHGKLKTRNFSDIYAKVQLAQTCRAAGSGSRLRMSAATLPPRCKCWSRKRNMPQAVVKHIGHSCFNHSRDSPVVLHRHKVNRSGSQGSIHPSESSQSCYFSQFVCPTDRQLQGVPVLPREKRKHAVGVTLGEMCQKSPFTILSLKYRQWTKNNFASWLKAAIFLVLAAALRNSVVLRVTWNDFLLTVA